MVRSWNILPFGAFHFQDFYECYILVLIIDSLYAVADASKHLIRYCVDSIRQHCNWQFLAKENNLIALFAVDISNVNHRNIHADIAHILGFLAVDKAIAVAVAEMSVQSIGITYRNSSNTRVACQSSAAAVSYGLIGGNIMNLQDCSLQRCHVIYHRVVARVVSIQSQSQSAHIELSFREVLNASRIVDMSQYLVWESLTQLLAALIKEFELMSRELVERIAVAAYEMREHRAWNNGRLMF